MNKKTSKKYKTGYAERCVECGKSVRFGSGKYVNRIPVFDDRHTKKGRPYPEGEYMCEECDRVFYDNITGTYSP